MSVVNNPSERHVNFIDGVLDNLYLQ
jgi:hypothetical protein